MAGPPASPVPPDGRCALHPEEPAAFLCPRCGDYGCTGCERRVSEGAAPLCVACWDKRAAHVETIDRRERLFLPKAALGVSIVALVPCIWPLQLGGVVLCLVALTQAQRHDDSRGRLLSLIGIALCVLGFAGTIAVLALGLEPF